MAPKATVEVFDRYSDQLVTEEIEEVSEFAQDGAGRYAMVITENGRRAFASLHNIMIHPS